MGNRCWISLAIVLVCGATMCAGQDKASNSPKSKPAAAESKDAKIKRALSAAPASIARAATVVDIETNWLWHNGTRSQQAKTTVLRQGANGFTCIAGHPGVVGDDPACMDAAASQWVNDWMAHKPKPTNTQPGIMYMLAGGTDWSASDPSASSGTPIKEPPHWMLMWPFDPKTSGLSDQAKQTGTWIMWAGTPYAHLMINQRP